MLRKTIPENRDMYLSLVEFTKNLESLYTIRAVATYVKSEEPA
jgi:hypothetical protein